MKTKILSALRNANEYISGQELSEMLGVSRTAVWKNISSLREAGYQIEAVRNRGYRLVEIPDVISPSEIKSRLGSGQMGCEIYYQAETTSTNVWARRLGDEGAPSGTVAIAQSQSQGRGRRGRLWQSLKGDNLYLSLLLRPEITPSKAPMLTLLMGLSVVQAINQELAVDAGIKWPNDIIVKGKKVGGILTEMSTQADYLEYLVIGVGLNCNSREIPEELSESATSLGIAQGSRIDRAQIVAAVLKRFEENYNQYLVTQDLTEVVDQYNDCLVHQNREITIIEKGQTYVGITRGINAHGELLVENQNHEIIKIFTGEISIRGLQGYID